MLFPCKYRYFLPPAVGPVVCRLYAGCMKTHTARPCCKYCVFIALERCVFYTAGSTCRPEHRNEKQHFDNTKS